jgi:hypothetical protein
MNFEAKFRRRLLLAGGGAIALLPWLEALGGGRAHRVSAQDQTPTKRFVVFFWPGGVIRDLYWPTGGELDFTMPYILEPVSAYRDKLLILDGLEMANMLDGLGHPHTRGMGGLLTGKALTPGQYSFFGDPTDFPQGMSIDHMIGNRIGAERRFKTLELGVLWPTYGTGPTPQNMISYSGPGQPAQPTSDPWAAFQRIFSGLDGGASMNDDAALRVRKTQLVLDSASAEFAAISRGLGVEDRRRLDEHLSRLAEIKASLVAPTGQGAACALPTGITEADGIVYATGGDGSHQTVARDASERMPTIGHQMIDTAVMSLACDLSRVVSIQYTDAASRASFPWLNLNENHHFYQHDGGFQQQPCADISRFFVEQFAYLLERLSEVMEGDKPLLESTTILMCSEIGDPPSHDHRRVPFVIAGGDGSVFRLGRYLKLGTQPHHKLLVSLLNSFGIDDTTIGDAKYGTGPLTGLT